MFHIEIRAEDDFVVVTIERGVKLRIAIVRRIKKQIKDDQARTGPKEPIKQKRPDFPGPRERPRGHQLERSIAGDLFRRQRWQLQCALIDSQKNEILRRGRFSAFLAKQILETLFGTPRRREKRRRREEMADKNQSGPKKTNHPQDQQSTATKPVHTRATITGTGDFYIAFRVQAFKAPSSNLQSPEKIQSPSSIGHTSPLSS